MRGAIERSPRDFELYLLRARIELEGGDLAAAETSFEHARRLNPLDPTR